MQYFVLLFVFVFFFKQKTAYEMRISDWSSDVCSSDLLERQRLFGRGGEGVGAQRRADHRMEEAQDAILVDRLDIGEIGEDFGFEGFGALRIARLGVVERAETLDQRGGQRRGVAQRADHRIHAIGDRKSVVWGKRVSVRVVLGGRRFIKKKKQNTQT